MSVISKKMMQASANTKTVPDDQSLIFDGNAYIYNFSASTNFGTEDFTLEAWVKPSNIGGYQGIVGQNYRDNGGQLYLEANSLEYYQGAGIVAGGEVNSSVWQHIAVSRQSNTFRVYLNGQEVASQTQSLSTVDNDLLIGGGSPAPNNVPSAETYNGLIYRPRISDFARYTGTAPFTPDPHYGNDTNTIVLVVAENDVVSEVSQGLPLSAVNVDFSSDTPA